MTVDVSLSDCSYGRQCKYQRWGSDGIQAPRAKYTLVGEAIRYVIPAHMQCSIGCGGQSCKYDSPGYWRDDQQAIKGLYSAWVSDHLLAMSRPSTETIEKYKIIDQFKRNGIKTVINLQIPGEHASCGTPLEPESGFSYRPEIFMENDIYFYNFGWSDYGVANLTTMLDMVKVMAFALQEGKIAVHCHAGLGRTGVLLACFLAYATRMTANQAILYVRAKRPNSIQTRGQLHCVREFVQFLAPLRSVFSCAEPRSNPVTLSQYLNRQRHILHGYERKELRNLPKIVRLVTRLLLDIAENRQVIEEDILVAPDIHDLEMTQSIIEQMGPEVLTREPRLPGTPTLPRHFNEPAIFYHRKSLSYSESDLRRLGSELNLLTQPLGPLSKSTTDTSMSPSERRHPPIEINRWGSNPSDVSQSPTGSLWHIKNEEKDGSILVRKITQTNIQHSECVGNEEPTKKGSMLSRWKEEQREGLSMNGMTSEVRQEEHSEVPFITLQSELSLESRRLLVAQALAVNIFLDGEEDHKRKVLAWQSLGEQSGRKRKMKFEVMELEVLVEEANKHTGELQQRHLSVARRNDFAHLTDAILGAPELNQGGGWERLCSERDPFILSGLMWTWLEQLKEPVVSIQEAKALNPYSTNAQTVLDTLDQASKETVTCVLHCMAQMLMIPEEVETAFLNCMIKAVTLLGTDSDDGRRVHDTLTTVLRCVLGDMRFIAIEAEDSQLSACSLT